MKKEIEQAKFVLSKKVLREQIKILEDLGLKISYSYKTNRVVGDIIQKLPECDNVDFSIHTKEGIEFIKNKTKVWFFLQAESQQEIEKLIDRDIKKFVIDNELDLNNLGKAAEKIGSKISLLIRMKFQEHRIGTGKYFVYGLPSEKVVELIEKLKGKSWLEKIGVHLHRKSQNMTEWEILEELKDSFSEKVLNKIDILNIGGGLPVKYVSMNKEVFTYIFSKIKEAQEWLKNKGIETIIEPGRFIAAPCIRLLVKIIQKQRNVLIINTTIYNCALDNILTGTKMLVLEEKSEDEEGISFLIKGNSPTRDDIFRYNVKLNKNITVGDEITFENAGAYNYTTDFFGYKKLDTEIKEDF